MDSSGFRSFEKGLTLKLFACARKDEIEKSITLFKGLSSRKSSETIFLETRIPRIISYCKKQRQRKLFSPGPAIHIFNTSGFENFNRLVSFLTNTANRKQICAHSSACMSLLQTMHAGSFNIFFIKTISAMGKLFSWCICCYSLTLLFGQNKL